MYGYTGLSLVNSGCGVPGGGEQGDGGAGLRRRRQDPGTHLAHLTPSLVGLIASSFLRLSTAGRNEVTGWGTSHSLCW